MRKTILLAALATLVAGTASAEVIGVSMQSFDNNFQTLLRQGIQAKAAEASGVTVQVEDAQTDISKQINQINNFIAAKVDAIIVTLADPSAAPAISQAASNAKIPLVYLNLEPSNVAKLPEKEAYIGSKETDSGKLAAQEACKLLKAKNKQGSAQVYILMGDLAHQASHDRTDSFKATLAASDCKGATIADEQSAAWQRTSAIDMTTNWITAGRPIDAVFANNDEMALGAIQAMKSSGISMKDEIVIGIDATQDGLSAMAAGDLAATVFQNAKAQSGTAFDTALSLARGKPAEKQIMVPFELVTPDNMDSYAHRN